MIDKTTRTEIALPDFSEVYTQSRLVRREAELARALYFSKLVSSAAKYVGNVYRRIGELFAFTQRMNGNARL